MHRRFWFLLLAMCLLAALPAPADDTRKPDPNDLSQYDKLVKPKHREHWAFQPVRLPAVPEVKDPAWARNPIDRFILAKLENHGWKPAEPAEPQALLRRVYLDLIGLPPTPAEQKAFLNDPAPDALDRVVNDLLARPAYGERWGRHWLDLVRYAETNGYERDAAKPHVWRYRDYVIRAFNADKPFDRFILEQLAGDELPDADTETLIATGYYRLGPWDDEPADPAEDRFDQLDDMVSTTSQVFLGLTLGCARCHNHKFEPLSTLDYYRWVAIVNPLHRPQNGRTELDLPAGSRSRVAEQGERDGKLALLAGSVVGSRLAFPASPFMIVEDSRALDRARRLRDQGPELPRGYFMRESSSKPPATHLLLRGKASRPGPEIAPGMPAVLVREQPVLLAPDQATSRRRLSLARWIASPENALTARVIVNRVWQFHFGEGLVATPSDFGTMGQPPSHPELLDWLAHRFVEDGWSLKKLHRLVLSSNTYRMSKRWNATYAAEDPENRLLWRFPYKRLEVETIRDSMLAVSGRLNHAMYGPSMYPDVPKEALEGHSDPATVWKPSPEAEASRRTIYAHVKRSMVVPMLEVLDLCDTTRSSAQRNVTTTAPQALTLLNSEFTNRQAAHFADRLLKDAGNDSTKQVEHAYLLALCRPPTATERSALVQFLEREAENLRKEAQGKVAQEDLRRRALVQMCRVILNLNEFLYPD